MIKKITTSLLITTVVIVIGFSQNGKCQGLNDYQVTEEETILSNSPTLFLENVLVKNVLDGNTIQIEYEGNLYIISLLGTDAPELEQDSYGLEAKMYLEHLILNKYINIVLEPSYRRKGLGSVIGYVFLGNVNINASMVKYGMSVLGRMEKSFIYYKDFIESDAYARKNGLGIFYRLNNVLRELPVYFREKMIGEFMIEKMLPYYSQIYR